MPTRRTGRVWLVCGVTLTAAAFVLATVAVLVPRAADALPLYAQRTGLPCGQCHLSPGGGGPRTAFGRAFAANGHHLPGTTRHGTREPSPRYYGPGYGHPYGMMGPGMMGGYSR